MPQGDTNALLASIRRHTNIPATHPSYTDELVLADATEELLSYLLPLGLVERQELWAGPTGRVSLPVQDGVATYSIPYRAVGGKVRAARLRDATGAPTPLSYYGREEVAPLLDTGFPSGLVLEGGTVRLFPTPRNMPGFTLEVDFYVRPSALVLPQRATQVISVTSSVSGEILFLMEPTDNADLVQADFLDVVSALPPFDVRALDMPVLAREDLGSGLWLLTVGTTAELLAGDWVCLPGEAPVVQAPLEWHPLLALKTAVRELASLGDMEGAAAKAREGQQKEKQAATLIRPRREDVARKPTNGMDRWRGPGSPWVY